MELEFDVKPESVQLLSWEVPQPGQYQDGTAALPEGTAVEVTVNEQGNPVFTAHPGTIYQVKGQWENGTVDYSFHVSAK